MALVMSFSDEDDDDDVDIFLDAIVTTFMLFRIDSLTAFGRGAMMANPSPVEELLPGEAEGGNARSSSSSFDG